MIGQMVIHRRHIDKNHEAQERMAGEMSWTTTGIKMKDNIPNEFENHNWNEDNLDVAVKWCRDYAKKGWVVSLYHNTIKPKKEGRGLK